MIYSLNEAALATGKSKSTIQRAIRSGRISAQIRPDRTYAIDASELHRVYPAKHTQQHATHVAQKTQRSVLSETTPQKTHAQLLAEVAELRGRLETTQQERQRERELMQQQAELYRLRLQHADELLKQQTEIYESRLERYDREKEQLTALLQDQRNRAKPSGILAWFKRG